MHKLVFCYIYNVMANTTLHHPYPPHIHTKYEITHIHTIAYTFEIIPIAYTTYIHTYHTYTIVKTRKNTKIKIIFFKKAKFCLFMPKYFKTSKAEIIFLENCKFLLQHFKMIVIVLLLSYTYSNYHNSHFGTFRKNIRCF